MMAIRNPGSKEPAGPDEACAPLPCWLERWEAGRRLPRHRHRHGYVAVVLSGGYEECGSRGRYRVRSGDALVHGAFDSHLNRFESRETCVLNLSCPGVTAAYGLGRITDPDALVRAAERSPAEARTCLHQQLAAAECEPQDWPDLLARDLLANPACRLASWAQRHGLAPETISRGFGRVFAMSPARFRLEARVRHAFIRIIGSDEPLSAVAAETGFADSAHMSRTIRALTGFPPRHWRESNSFKTRGMVLG